MKTSLIVPLVLIVSAAFVTGAGAARIFWTAPVETACNGPHSGQERPEFKVGAPLERTPAQEF